MTELNQIIDSKNTSENITQYEYVSIMSTADQLPTHVCLQSEGPHIKLEEVTIIKCENETEMETLSNMDTLEMIEDTTNIKYETEVTPLLNNADFEIEPEHISIKCEHEDKALTEDVEVKFFQTENENDFNNADIPEALDTDDFLEKQMLDDIKISKMGKSKRVLKCYMCDFTTMTNRGLKAHKLRHYKIKSLKCDKCSYATAVRADLRKHSVKHQEEKRYKCDKCSFSAKFSINLKRHIKGKHSRDKLFQCSECNFSTVWSYSLNKHIKTHAHKYRCEKCSYTTTARFYLLKHISKHDQIDKANEYVRNIMQNNINTKCYKCSQCDYNCKYATLLTVHMKTHQNN